MGSWCRETMHGLDFDSDGMPVVDEKDERGLLDHRHSTQARGDECARGDGK
jgi:hypothetical protein